MKKFLTKHINKISVIAVSATVVTIVIFMATGDFIPMLIVAGIFLVFFILLELL